MQCLETVVVAGLVWSSLLLEPAYTSPPRWQDIPGRGAQLQLFSPRFAERSPHGVTVKSEHFVVVATTNKGDAAWVAEELERTWAEIGRLADQWTTVHRQPGFGQAGISVVIAEQPRHPRSPPTACPHLALPGPDIYVDLSDSQESLQERLSQIRSEAFAAFLRVCRHDMLMPEWVQVGLASYFSGTPVPETVDSLLPAPAPFVSPTKGAWARRVLLDGGAMSVEDRQQATQAAIWVRYLLEGDDAQHADQFFRALATTLAQGSQDELSLTEKARGVVPRPAVSLPQNPVRWNRLINEQIASHEFSDWLADRRIGQPIVESEPAAPTLDERQQEMVLILKLARRFPRSATVSRKPHVYEFQSASSADVLKDSEEPVNLVALYQRLIDPKQPRWATIDIDGRLLFSSDRERLAALFAPADRTYRTYEKDGHTVLEASFSSGEVLEGWLEENPLQPKRPIVHLRRKPAEPTTTTQQSAHLPENAAPHRW